jgi:hypothetical protein
MAEKTRLLREKEAAKAATKQRVFDDVMAPSAGC